MAEQIEGKFEAERERETMCLGWLAGTQLLGVHLNYPMCN